MTDNEVFEENLSHFKITKRYQNKAQCICPAHADKQASLTISQGRKCTLFHCHANCSIDSILSAAGLELKNTFYDSEQPKASWQAYIETREERKIEAVYDYVNCDTGNYCFTKLRMTGKKMLYGRLQNNRFVYGLGHDVSRKSFKAIYGSVQAIKKAINEGKPIFIPEGEKDTNTLTKQGYTAFTYGGCGDWQSDFAELVKGADVVILADNDSAGIKVANTILNDIKSVAKSAKIVIPVPDIPKADISDYFQAGHTKEEFEQMINAVIENRVDRCLTKCHTPEEVKELLSYSISQDKDGNMKSKKVIQSVRNNEIILENDRRFAGRLCFNEFSRQDYLVGSVPWDTSDNYRAWNSHDDSALFSIIQSDYGMNNRQDYFDAVKNVSMKFKFHPVKDILDGLEWDGKEHIRNLLPDYLGAENTEYTYEVMKLFMLGAVSRIYQPGCKFDYTLILQGKQGIGKSTFLQMLALSSEWFNDSMDSLDSDKSAQALSGTWIVEFGELKALARTSGGVDSVKRFLSATQDKLRLPYERRCDIFLRQCVFTGTTNKSDFLQDETGNRRFLIIHTGVNKPNKNLFNLSAMDDIKQAWAEVMHIYRTEKPQLVLSDSFKEEAEQLQANSTVDDGKTGIIEEYLKDKDRTCALEIWQEALHEQGRPVRWQATEINSIIDSFPDWERMNTPYKFTKYGNQRGFKRVQSSSEFVECTQEEIEQLPFS